VNLGKRSGQLVDDINSRPLRRPYRARRTGIRSRATATSSVSTAATASSLGSPLAFAKGKANAERWHARNLALELIALGYPNVSWYRGGVEAWNVAGYPVVKKR
jgi:rhodanese-related sulfurtransferase